MNTPFTFDANENINFSEKTVKEFYHIAISCNAPGLEINPEKGFTTAKEAIKAFYMILEMCKDWSKFEVIGSENPYWKGFHMIRLPYSWFYGISETGAINSCHFSDYHCKFNKYNCNGERIIINQLEVVVCSFTDGSFQIQKKAWNNFPPENLVE